MSNFGGVRVAWSWELRPRLLAWAGLLLLSLGRPLLVATLVVGVLQIRRRNVPAQGRLQLSGWLWLFLLAYGLLHWLLAVPVWDRYLLPVLPLLAVLTGDGIAHLITQHRDATEGNRAAQGMVQTVWFIRRSLVTCLITILLLWQLPIALAARQGHFPIGGQPAADHGAAEIGRYLWDAPYGTVLYDHWYSWHWRYHFFDRGVYVSWFPHPQALVEDLNVFGRQPAAANGARRYLALPASAVALPVIRAVEAAGFRLQPIYRAAQMVLYRVEAGQP
jgi:hypothetical protein